MARLLALAALLALLPALAACQAPTPTPNASPPTPAPALITTAPLASPTPRPSATAIVTAPPSATQPPPGSDCPTPPAAQVPVTPVDGPAADVVTFPPFAVPVHGLLFRTGDGLQAFEAGELSTIVTWSALEGLVGHALSPDGRRLACSRTGSDLWVADLPEGRATPLIRGAIRAEHAELFDCAWSPDGAWLAVLVGGAKSEGKAPWPEYWTVFTVEVSSGRIFEITSGTSAFAWVAQAGELAYTDRCLRGDALFAVRPDGSGRRLVYAAGAAEYFERWLESSPHDGTLLLAETGKLVAVNPCDGSAVDLLSRYGNSQLRPQRPTWSPDGQRVAFLGEEGPLYVVDAVSGQVKRGIGLFQGGLRWSPDGSMLAVVGWEWHDPLDAALHLVALEEAGPVERQSVKVPPFVDLMDWR